ncbi:MAG: hypothetical protein AB7H80_10805 [Candidatus Kapaibacterium sp.]
MLHLSDSFVALFMYNSLQSHLMTLGTPFRNPFIDGSLMLPMMLESRQERVIRIC